MARKLKVFQAQFGFNDSVVAAPSQAAALRAWGAHQNLFADGQARITTDVAAMTAALAHPGVPLLRAVGSDDAFALKPLSLPKIPDGPKRATGSKPKAKVSPEPPPAPPADRSKLDAAEAALRRLDDDRKREEAGLRKRREALDAESAKTQAAYVEGRKAAATALVQARKAYRDTGGRD